LLSLECREGLSAIGSLIDDKATPAEVASDAFAKRSFVVDYEKMGGV
jgi:hypothetical protein